MISDRNLSPAEVARGRHDGSGYRLCADLRYNCSISQSARELMRARRGPTLSLFSQSVEAAMEIAETIRDQISSHNILLYMKGTPQAPQCGFSAQTVQCLMGCGQKFAYVNILENPEIRANLPAISDWPTFPQLFVDGELVGGCDIITEMYQAGELQTLIGEAASSDSED